MIVHHVSKCIFNISVLLSFSRRCIPFCKWWCLTKLVLGSVSRQPFLAQATKGCQHAVSVCSLDTSSRSCIKKPNRIFCNGGLLLDPWAWSNPLKMQLCQHEFVAISKQKMTASGTNVFWGVVTNPNGWCTVLGAPAGSKPPIWQTTPWSRVLSNADQIARAITTNVCVLEFQTMGATACFVGMQDRFSNKLCCRFLGKTIQN